MRGKWGRETAEGVTHSPQEICLQKMWRGHLDTTRRKRILRVGNGNFGQVLRPGHPETNSSHQRTKVYECFRNATIAKKTKQITPTPVKARIQHNARNTIYQHLAKKEYQEGCAGLALSYLVVP